MHFVILQVVIGRHQVATVLYWLPCGDYELLCVVMYRTHGRDKPMSTQDQRSGASTKPAIRRRSCLLVVHIMKSIKSENYCFIATGSSWVAVVFCGEVCGVAFSVVEFGRPLFL